MNYVKKPLAVNSFVSAGIALAALLFLGGSFYLTVRSQGNASVREAAMGLCSMICSVVSVLYGIQALLEKDKNYILAKIGLAACALILLVWIVIIIIGIWG